MSETLPQFPDGRTAVIDPVVECLNLAGNGTTYQRYGYLSDTIDTEAKEMEHSLPSGSPLGSFTQEGFKKGAINLQVNLLTEKVARPGHIVRLDVGDGNGWKYYIAGKFGRQRTLHDVTKGALQVKACYNPIVSNFLSEDFGWRKVLTQAAGALADPINAVVVPLNTRTGSTLAYSIVAAPGYTLPGWLSCSSSTGALSGTAVAGTFEFDVVCTETLTNYPTRVGAGRVTLVIT